MDKRCIVNIRYALAQIARQFGKEHVHLADIDKRFQFVFQRMGITSRFRQIKEEAELLADSSNLQLSIWFNWMMLALAIVAFILAVLQIVQNYLYNLKSKCMEDTLTLKVIFETPQQKTPVGCCEDPVMFALYVIFALIFLMVLYHYVLLPIVRKQHEQFHRNMEDEE